MGWLVGIIPPFPSENCKLASERVSQLPPSFGRTQASLVAPLAKLFSGPSPVKKGASTASQFKVVEKTGTTSVQRTGYEDQDEKENAVLKSRSRETG